MTEKKAGPVTIKQAAGSFREGPAKGEFCLTGSLNTMPV